MPQHTHLKVIIIAHPYISRPVVIRVRMRTEKASVHLNYTKMWIQLQILSIVLQSTLKHAESKVASFNVDTRVPVRFKRALADVDCILSVGAPSEQAMSSVVAYAAVMQVQ